MNNQKFAKLIALLIVVAAIPITVFVAQNQQETRQRAQVRTQSGTADVYFQKAGNTDKIDTSQKLNLNPEQSTTLNLYLEAPPETITGFDLTVTWGGWMSLQYVTAGAGAASFEEDLVRLPDQRSGNLARTIHFSKVNPNGAVGDKLHIMSITLVAGTPTSYASGQIIVDGIITSKDFVGNAASFQAPIDYVILDRSRISAPPPDQGCKDPRGCGGTTPTPSRRVTPTNTPTPRTTGTPTPRTSGTPTGSITPTPTGDGGTGKHTRFELVTVLQAIGPLVKGNINPKNKERQVKIEVFDNNSSGPILTKIGTVTYEESTGFFKALVDMGDTLKTGDYAVKIQVIKPIGYLRKLIPPGIVHVTAGETNRMPQTDPSVTLIVGDINIDNALDILDYNAYVSCFGDRAKDKNVCKDPNAVDLNDDGKTDDRSDLTDYRWLFESFKVQHGD